MTGNQIRMALAALGWNVRVLAERAEVPLKTILKMRAGKPALPPTLAAVREAFEVAGIRFIDNGEWAGVTTRKDMR